MATTEPSANVEGGVESPEVDPTLDPALVGGNELVADTLGEYLRGQWKKIRAGESGVLPVVLGLIVIVIIFQTQNSHFLSTGNLVNLIGQAGVFVLLGMAEVFVLLLGEIDLSTGYVAGVGAVVTAELATTPHNVNWFLAVLAGLATCAVIGFIHGLIITRLGLPSFVVTLAGYLGWFGFLEYLIEKDKYATGGTIAVTNGVINDIVNGAMSTVAGWIVMIAVVVVYAALTLFQTERRRRSGLVTPPMALTLVKIAAIAVAGVVLVLICNHNRSLGLGTRLVGMPWVVLVLLGALVLYSVLLGRMRFGRYMYAIGGNAEAARRAGISLNNVRLSAFVLCSLTAGMAGMVYLSQLGSVSNDIQGGNLVLYGIAAAVLGGTSLFGGRGKMSYAVLGGVIVATVFNGLALIKIGAAGQEMVIALVLLVAVTVDSVARRGRVSR